MFLEGEDAIENETIIAKSCMNEDFLVYTEPCHSAAFFDKLYDLYTRCELCDVNLCVDGKMISAHKIVLASNSIYFEGL